MRQKTKNEILKIIKDIDNIKAFLNQLISEENEYESPKIVKTVEMITIKECTEAIYGVKEHTIRQLIAQGKLKYIRTGQGKRGKILVNKDDLLNYFAS